MASIYIHKKEGKRGVSWQARVLVERGKQPVYVGSFPTRNEAKEAAAAELVAYQPLERLTLEALRDKWLATETVKWRASSYKNNLYGTKSLVEMFGNVEASKFTTAQADEWAKGNEHRVRHGRQMFNFAMKHKLVAYNPFSNAQQVIKRGRKDLDVINEEQFQNLLSIASKHHGEYGTTLYALILFAGRVGARKGECVALNWQDLDFANKRVTINKTLSNDKDIAAPKNGKSRVVVLPDDVISALKEVPKVAGSDRVFNSIMGGLLTRSKFAYIFDAAAGEFTRKANLDYKFTFHMLRHFAATTMIYRLNLKPQFVAVQLGHTDGGKLVLETYSHLAEREALEAVEKAYEDASNNKEEKGDNITPLFPEDEVKGEVA
jgi:integrase